MQMQMQKPTRIQTQIYSLLLLLQLLPCFCFAHEQALPSAVELKGEFVIRLPEATAFVSQKQIDTLPENTIAAVMPNPDCPLASSSVILLASRTICLYPGASIKICKSFFVPITGRFAVSGEGDLPITIANRYFELKHTSGEALIEITPDNGLYIAMCSKKGNAFVRCQNRKIYDLNKKSELFIPLFGKPKLINRLSGFWAGPPSGFSALHP